MIYLHLKATKSILLRIKLKMKNLAFRDVFFRLSNISLKKKYLRKISIFASVFSVIFHTLCEPKHDTSCIYFKEKNYLRTERFYWAASIPRHFFIVELDYESKHTCPKKCFEC